MIKFMYVYTVKIKNKYVDVTEQNKNFKPSHFQSTKSNCLILKLSNHIRTIQKS